jgi:hypothetical protein
LEDQGLFLTSKGFLDQRYRFTREGDQVRLNGEPLLGPESKVFASSVIAARRLSPMRSVIHALAIDGVVIRLDETHFVVIAGGDELQALDGLSPSRPEEERLEKLTTIHIPGMTIERWNDFLHSCVFSEEAYEGVVGPRLESYRRVVEENRSNSRWARQIGRLEKMGFTYLLNLVGLALVTLAFGTLLTQRPGESAVDEQASKRRARNLCLNTGLIVALSLFDLSCTLFAHLSGGFKELNPIGSALAENPMNLMLFKVVTLLISATILIALRHHPRAQLASWWLCLVLVVLTFRWTTYHGMML